MAGKKRLTVIEEKITQLENARQSDAADQWLATLSSDQLTELERRLVEGEDPLTVAKDFMT